MMPINMAIVLAMNAVIVDAASDVSADSAGGVGVPWCRDRIIALMLRVSLGNQQLLEPLLHLGILLLLPVSADTTSANDDL